jgi:hypothetical protein
LLSPAFDRVFEAQHQTAAPSPFVQKQTDWLSRLRAKTREQAKRVQRFNA